VDSTPVQPARSAEAAARTVLPGSLFRYIWKQGGLHQGGLAALSAAVFLLSAVPLEIQRRVVNDALLKGTFRSILWLAVAYVAVAIAEGALKLAMNVYRGWVSETAVRHLRRTVTVSVEVGSEAPSIRSAEADGIEISMVLSEVEPVGAFIGSSVSEPLLQGGILLSVFGYMIFLQPEMALICLAVLSPQVVFVPLMQHAMNVRARDRIRILRDVSGGIVAHEHAESSAIAAQNSRIDRVFSLNMVIYKLKYSMNFLMNGMYHVGIAAILAVGGWYVLQGRIEAGTVVAFLSGLAKVNEPWGDIVNWFREMTVSRVKYGLIADASGWLASRPTRHPRAP
jgi:ABC-type bacteriocin/lantibiotic exporter with double-glycine peptidase domain